MDIKLENEKMCKKDTSVPYSINGWNFQVAAAIYTFLNYLKDVEKIGLEKTEDAEIVLKNGKTVFVQAKSSLSPDDIEKKSQFSKIKDSIRTLEGRDNTEVERLIILFNFFKPFGNSVTFDPYAYDKKRYDDLTTEAKQMLDDVISDNHYVIDKNKLGFWLLKFDGENKHAKLLEFFKESFRIDNFYNYDNVLEKWRILLYDNGSQVKRYIEKELLAGAAFQEMLSDEISEELLDNLEIEYFPGDIDEVVKPEYWKHIQKLTYRFSLCNKYTVRYLEFIKNNKQNLKGDARLYEYIKKEATILPREIEILFDDLSNEKEKCNMYKLFLYSIGMKYRKVRQISEVMGFEA